MRLSRHERLSVNRAIPKVDTMIMRKVVDQTFRNAVVYITGNHYLRCDFHTCTFVFHGLPVSFDSCKFHGSLLWRLEFTVHDSDQWDEFMSTLASLITKMLPKLPPESK